MSCGCLVLTSNFSKFQDLLSYFRCWNHTDIRTNSKVVCRWASITMKCPTIEENEVTSLWVNLDRIAQRLFPLLLLRNREPVFIMIHTVNLAEELLMVFMGLRYANETSTVLPRVCQGHDSLVTPKMIPSWWLVSVKSRIYRSLLILQLSIHKTKTIKWCL